MGTTWWAGVLELPDGQGRAFLVQDRDTHDLRLTRILGPHDDLGDLLRMAADVPDAGAPGAPDRVVTVRAVAPKLRKAAKQLKAKLKVQPALPTFDRLFEELGDALRERPSPVGDPARWAVVRAALQARPWEVLPHPQVAFVLHGVKVLRGRAVELVGVHGRGGCGVLVHDSFDALLRYGALGEHQVERLPMSAQLVPCDELTDEQVQHYASLGLAADGEALLVSRGLWTLLPLDASDEPAARAAIEGVLAALAQHGPALCDGETRTVAQTEVGPVVVQGLAVTPEA